MAYITDIDPTSPTGADAVSDGDDQLRTLKTDIQQTFPNMAGEVSANQTAVNRKIPPQTAAELSAGAAVAANNEGYEIGDIRRYGAVVDGATDDTAAVQGAIDAAHAGGFPVILPPGVIRVTAPLEIPGDSVVIRGAGRMRGGTGAGTLIQADHNGHGFINGEATTDRIYYGVMEDFTMQSLQATTDKCGVYGVNWNSFTLSRLWFIDFQVGVCWSTTQVIGNCVRNRCEQVRAQGAEYGCMVGWSPVVADQAAQLGSTNAHTFNQCRFGATTLAAAYLTNCNEVHLFQCGLEGGASRGVHLVAPTSGNTAWNFILCCRFENNSGPWLEAESGCSNNTVAFNQVQSTQGQLVDNSTRLTLIGIIGDQDASNVFPSITQAPYPSHVLERSTRAGATDGTPAVLIQDTSTNDEPVTLAVKNPDSTGDARAVTIRDGSDTDVFQVRSDGRLYTNQYVVDPSQNDIDQLNQPFDGYIPFYDPSTGAFVGFIPILDSLAGWPPGGP